MSEILAAKDIFKSYPGKPPVEVLKGISLCLNRGESLAVRGLSGQGKSTLLLILGTLETPTEGELRIEGKPVESARAPNVRNTQIGFLFQAFFLLEEDTALDNVLMPARIGKQPVRKGSLAYERAISLLQRARMEARAHTPAKYLSGGEKQRVALARALCNDPLLLLADEPTGNLDETSSESIYELIWQETIAKNKGLIVVTHDERLAKRCDRTLYLQDGKLT